MISRIPKTLQAIHELLWRVSWVRETTAVISRMHWALPIWHRRVTRQSADSLMTSRIHRFRELTVTHTPYEAWLGRQASRAAFSQIQTASGTVWCDAFGGRHFAFEGRHGVSAGRHFFRGRHHAFGGRRVVCTGRQGTFSGRHAAFGWRHHVFRGRHSTFW